MQSVSSRIWTHVVVFISCDDNNYTTVYRRENVNILVYLAKYSEIMPSTMEQKIFCEKPYHDI